MTQGDKEACLPTDRDEEERTDAQSVEDAYAKNALDIDASMPKARTGGGLEASHGLKI